MKKRNHVTREAVRKELSDHEFVTGFSSPGRPELWCKPGDKSQRFAVQRETLPNQLPQSTLIEERWHIISYPEPAACSPEQLVELTARDGVVLYGGAAPGQVTVESEFEWMDTIVRGQ